MSPTGAPPRRRVLVRADVDALRSLGERLDRLQLATGAPVMSRRTWLQVWLDTHSCWTPLVVAVEDPDGSLVAAALMATQRRLGLTTVVLMGHQSSDMVLTSALDDRAADQLAGAVEDHLATLRPWNLMLRNVHPTDPLLPRLSRRLQRSLLLDGDVSPVLRVDRGADLDTYVSTGHRKRNNQLRNRMRRDGLRVDLDHVCDSHEVLALLPEVETIHRLRDEDVGRTSGMDKPSEHAFFHQLVGELASAGQVCLTTLRLDGALAAYGLCFVDGTDFRFWNTRFDPHYSAHSPGKLVVNETVRNSLTCGATSFDFMRGDEPYKASYANDEVRAIEMLAGSNLGVAAGHRGYLAGREWLRRMDDSGECSGDLAERLRDVRRRLRR